MSFDSWTCLMVEKGPGTIDDSVRSALKLAACDLNLQKYDRMKIVSDVCDGIIETEWNTYTVGTRSGVLFRAEIDAPAGSYKVNFLLHTADLERGAAILRDMEERGIGEWVRNEGKIPCDALYHFHDLQGPRRTLH